MAEAGSQFIVKFVYGDDMRRVRFRDVSYELLQQAAREAFLDAPTAPASFDLKYEDDEGDQCTLTPATFSDFMDMSKSQVARLWLVAPRPQATPSSTGGPSIPLTPDSHRDMDGATSFSEADGATSFPKAANFPEEPLNFLHMLPQQVHAMLRLVSAQLTGSSGSALAPLLTALAPRLREQLSGHEAEVDQALGRCVSELLPVLLDVDEVLKPLQPFHEVRIMLGEVLKNAGEEGATLNGLGAVLHEFLTVFCSLPPAQQHDTASSLAQALGAKLEQLVFSHLPSPRAASCPPQPPSCPPPAAGCPPPRCPPPAASCPPPAASCPPPGWLPPFHKGWGKGWGKDHCGKGWGKEHCGKGWGKKGKEPFLKGLVKGLVKGHGKGWWSPPREEDWLQQNDSDTWTDTSSSTSHSSSSCDWHIDSAKKECYAAKVACKRACKEAKERYKSEVKAAKQCLKQAKKEWKKERHEWKKEKKSHKHGHKHGRHHRWSKEDENCGRSHGGDDGEPLGSKGGGQMDVEEADMAERSTVASAAAPAEAETLPYPPAEEKGPEVDPPQELQKEPEVGPPVELRSLKEMGFDDTELNKRLLDENNWDVAAVITILLSRGA